MAAHSELTGNDYVSIPAIGPDASLDAINVLHAASAGLIEWTGPAAGGGLLRPAIMFDGTPVAIEEARWRRLDRWIPAFTVSLADGSTISGTICAPGGYPPARGFVLRIEAENRGRSPRELRVDLDIAWAHSRLWIATPRALEGDHLIRLDEEASALTLETRSGHGPALAIGTGAMQRVERFTEDGAATAFAPGGFVSARNGELLRARVSQTVSVKSNSRAAVVFNVGAGRERDGARTAAEALRRHGPDHWIRQARLDLSHSVRPAQDHRWAELLNRNLLFNRYYAVGRAIDDDRLYLLRSRSTQCASPAVFNEREALLWTLPSLIIADPGIAREALFRMLDLTSERSGEHLRYIDGGALDAAFVLDQFLLYSWAIDHYATSTGDSGVLDDPIVRQVITETDAAAYMRLHPQHLMAATDLLPSGDVADYPYATMANALLRAFCDRLPRLLPAVNGDEPPPRFQDAGPEISAAIWQYCVSDVDGHPVLASSSSLEGDVAVYDDPVLSLALLPFFGFCTTDDPIWRATMDFLHSTRYPLWREGAVPGLAARSGSRSPKTAALCAELLTDRSDAALDRLLQLRLPGGVAAAEYDPDSGQGVDPHHAALAGFVAWALVHAAEPKDNPAAERKTRRR